MPLHAVAIDTLQKLRREPDIDQRVFPVRGSLNPAGRVSHLFADLCVAVGLTKTVDRDGQPGWERELIDGLPVFGGGWMMTAGRATSRRTPLWPVTGAGKPARQGKAHVAKF